MPSDIFSSILRLFSYAPQLLLHTLNGPKLNCWSDGAGGNNDGSDMLVLASAAKSGAVLSARLAVEVF